MRKLCVTRKDTLLGSTPHTGSVADVGVPGPGRLPQRGRQPHTERRSLSPLPQHDHAGVHVENLNAARKLDEGLSPMGVATDDERIAATLLDDLADQGRAAEALHGGVRPVVHQQHVRLAVQERAEDGEVLVVRAAVGLPGLPMIPPMPATLRPPRRDVAVEVVHVLSIRQVARRDERAPEGIVIPGTPATQAKRSAKASQTAVTSPDPPRRSSAGTV
jgi:hypothetical protein